jgi:hypothetical protein
MWAYKFSSTCRRRQSVPHCLPKIILILSPSTSTSSKWCLPVRLLKIFCTHLSSSHTIYIFHESHLLHLTTKSAAPEHESSSPCSQEPATGPYPGPTESTLHPQPVSLRSVLIPFSHLCLGLPSGPFHSGFPTKTLYSFFELINLITFSKETSCYI